MGRNTDKITNSRANYTAGACMFAPVGTTLPTSAATSLSGAFKDSGTIADSGITQTIERETEKKVDMNGDTVFVIDKSHSLKFKIPFFESLNANVLKLYLGESNVTTDANGALVSYTISGGSLENHACVMNLITKTGDLMRVCIPELALLSSGEESRKVSDVTNVELEFEALPDAYGNKAYVYFATPTSSGANMLSYAISALGMNFDGVINDADGTIDVTVPNGTSLTALKAVFQASNGASVKIGSTSQSSGVTTNNFTNPQTYTVTSSNTQRTKNYIVTVTAASL